MTTEIAVQVATRFEPVPAADELRAWAAAALQGLNEVELVIRLVDEAESRELNARYRNIDSPTNVLSFPADLPESVDVPLMGDIVICAPLVSEQAAVQGKPVKQHWAHLVIHGVLHLLGHDHVEDSDAEEMETIEISLLRGLDIPNPYE